MGLVVNLVNGVFDWKKERRNREEGSQFLWRDGVDLGERWMDLDEGILAKYYEV